MPTRQKNDPVINTHAHLWKGHNFKYLDRMAEDGVITQVWIQAHECHRITPTYRSATSAHVLEASRRYPGFILPFGCLSWLKDASQVDRMRENGFSGMKAIRPIYAYDDERYFPLYETYEWGLHGEDFMYNNAKRFRDEKLIPESVRAKTRCSRKIGKGKK